MDAMRHTIQSVLDANRAELGGWVSDYAYWDAFVDKVVIEPDPVWIEGNIGGYAHENLDVDVALLVDGSNEPYVVSTSEGLSLADPLSKLPDALAPLVFAARQDTGPVDKRPPPQETFLRLDDRVFIAAAAVAKWEAEDALPVRNGGPVVLVYLREINGARLAAFSRDYMVRELALARPGEEEGDGLALRNLDSQIVAYLVWQSPTPGTEFLRSLAVPMVVIVLVAAGMLVWIIGRIRATVGQILNAHEALLVARDEADRANRAKTEFLAQMSHDLRTPLNAILGFSEVIALQTFGSDAAASDRYRDYARQIHRGGDHLRTLIDSILDVARLDAGRYELRLETLSLDKMIATCLSLLSTTLEAKKIAVEAPPTGLSFVGDRGAIEQILLNLVGNAAKYTDPGGTVAIEAQSLQQGLSIVIRDTGRGMSDEDLDKAFELFTRGGGTLGPASSEGSGLGLSIVKRLVTLHGGSISLESQVGVGTTVTVLLPNAVGTDRVAAGSGSEPAA